MKHLRLLALTFLLSACLGGGGGSGSDLANAGSSTAAAVKLSANQILIPTQQSSVVTVTVYADAAQTLPLANASLSANLSGTAQLNNVPAQTGSNGQAQFSVSSNSGENSVLTVKSGTITQTLNLYFGAQVQLSVNNNFQRANGTSTITLSTVVRDAQNVPLTGIAVTLRSASDAAFFSAYQGNTGSNGQFVSTATSSTAESFTVYALAGGLQSQTANLTFIAPVSSLDLSASDSLVKVGQSTDITLYVRQSVDAQIGLSGNGLPNTPFNASVSGAAQLRQVPARTDSSGTARFQVSNSLAENVILTVTSGTETRTLPLYFGANLSVLPQTSNAIQSRQLTALLKDGNGTPMSNQSVEFGFIGANTKTLTPITSTTNEQGTAQITVSDIGNEGGLTVVRARSGQIEAQASINFLATLAAGQNLAVEPSVALRGVSSPLTITAAVSDSTGTPVSGTTVNFSTSGNARFQDGNAQLSAITDAAGKAYATVNNNAAENSVVTVAVGTTQQTVPVYFGARLKVVPLRADGSAGGQVPVTLSANVSDHLNRGIAGVPVYFRSITGSALLDNFQGVSDERGIVSVNVTNTAVELTQLEASVSGLGGTLAEINFATLGGANGLSSILLATVPSPPLLTVNGQATISARVLDSDNLPAPDGTAVYFSTNGIGRIPQVAFTQSGNAQVTFNAGTATGIAAITAKLDNGVSSGTNVTIQATSTVGSIEIISIEPTAIGITGSGTVQTSRLKFMVKDPSGNPVADGLSVTFSLDNTRLGGGELLSSGSQTGSSVNDITIGGEVSVVVKSGKVAGPIDVIASIDAVSTVAQVSIVGGLPDARHLGLAAEMLSMEGFRYGTQNTITAYLGDRFGNIVPNGTRVNFISEGGLIGTSQPSGAFTSTTQFGQATAILQTALPNRDLGGITPVGNSGYNRVVAYTTGSESFIDSNGNGIYDADEPFLDSTEPFIDGNDSGVWELGELFIDVDGDGAFDGSDGVYQANTTIWIGRNILFSNTASSDSISVQVLPAVLPPTFNTCASGSVGFESTVADSAGNPLAVGTNITVTANKGVLSGTTTLSVPDSFSLTSFSFELSNPDKPSCLAGTTVQTTAVETIVTVSAISSNGVGAAKSITGKTCTYACQ